MVANISGANVPRQTGYPAQAYASMYSNQLFDDDTFMGLGPIGGSVSFEGGTMGSPFSPDMVGGTNRMGMGGYAYGPGSEVMKMTQKEYMNHLEDLENMKIDQEVNRQKKISAATFSLNADDAAITREIGILQRKVKNNEQESVMKEYNKLTQLVENKLVRGGAIQQGQSREQVKAHAEKLYFENTGKSLIEDIEKNGDTSFTQGLKQGVGLGLGSIFTNKTNSEDTISQITGEDKDKSSTAWNIAGIATSAILTLGLLVAGVKCRRAIKAH